MEGGGVMLGEDEDEDEDEDQDEDEEEGEEGEEGGGGRSKGARKWLERGVGLLERALALQPHHIASMCALAQVLCVLSCLFKSICWLCVLK